MLQYAVPPSYQRQQPTRKPKLGPWLGVIDAILEDDKLRPAKQPHTTKRIFERLKEEHGFTGGYRFVKDYLVDPEKVIFRQIEVECCRPSGLAGRASRSILRSGRREKCTKKL